jgi:hypothetical protein
MYFFTFLHMIRIRIWDAGTLEITSIMKIRAGIQLYFINFLFINSTIIILLRNSAIFCRLHYFSLKTTIISIIYLLMILKCLAISYYGPLFFVISFVIILTLILTSFIFYSHIYLLFILFIIILKKIF